MRKAADVYRIVSEHTRSGRFVERTDKAPSGHTVTTVSRAVHEQAIGAAKRVLNQKEPAKR